MKLKEKEEESIKSIEEILFRKNQKSKVSVNSRVKAIKIAGQRLFKRAFFSKRHWENLKRKKA